MIRVCKHCRERYSPRAGRGLCRTCWQDQAIREKYPPLAPFGGKEANDVWAKYKARRRQKTT